MPDMTAALHIGLAWARPVEFSDDALSRAHAALLSPAEQAQHARFLPAETRRHYLVAHALLRRCLGAELERPPLSLEFATTDHGQPLLPDIHFSLTHTDGLVACCWCRDARVGLDAEDHRRPVDIWSLAGRVCAPAEQRWLHGSDLSILHKRFFSLWTLKEALLKGQGTGLVGDMTRAEFELSDGEVRIVGDDSWRADLIHLVDTHVVALAVEHDGPLTVTTQEVRGEV